MSAFAPLPPRLPKTVDSKMSDPAFWEATILEDITIKVGDRGGGIKRSQMPLLWLYTPDSTVWEGRRLLRGLPRRPVHGGEGAAGASFRGHFEGGGWGLPMSRLFARYFGGDLRIVSVEGYGTDAFIQLNRLANQPESLTSE